MVAGDCSPGPGENKSGRTNLDRNTIAVGSKHILTDNIADDNVVLFPNE
jgi:hypothetical protein